jgi:hypothetical protein
MTTMISQKKTKTVWHPLLKIPNNFQNYSVNQYKHAMKRTQNIMQVLFKM